MLHYELVSFLGLQKPEMICLKIINCRVETINGLDGLHIACLWIILIVYIFEVEIIF